MDENERKALSRSPLHDLACVVDGAHLLHFVGDQVVLAMRWCCACSCNMAT